jgi:hypothetical protein
MTKLKFKTINKITKSALTIVSAIALAGILASTAGCQEQQKSETEFDRVSREIEQIRAEAEQTGNIGNIKIEVKMLGTNDSEYSKLSALWQYSGDNITLSGGERPSKGGLRVGLAAGDFESVFSAVRKKLRTSEVTEMFLLVSPGYPGSIFVGKEIAVERFYYFGRWYTGVGYDFRQAGRSLRVTAWPQPDGSVKMQLLPVFSDFKNDRGDLELTEISTTVTARPGQAVIIGSMNTNTQDAANAFFSYTETGQNKQMVVTVTPYLR